MATRTWINQWQVPGDGPAPLWRRLTPPQLLVGSFLLLILLGTLGLKWLPGLYTGPGLSWVDALFTATSAVCVTGLIVVDTATYFTTAGQAFLLLLIQLGGLGIITFTTLIILALGGRLSVRHQELSASTARVVPAVDYRGLTRTILLFTILVEGLGALLLYLLWGPELGWAGAVWPAVFQAISAFCNAGFSTYSDSLMSFAGEPLVLLLMAALIVIGGLGFLVIEELKQLWRLRRRRVRFQLSLHSRLVLATTAVLLVGGTLLYALLEWGVTLAGMPPGDRFVNAMFMSVTARTAGFNTIDYARAADDTNFLTMLFMSIGGSPGSTAGGMKTTTVALIGLLAWSRIRGRATVTVWRRSVPGEVVQRAVGLFVVATGVMLVGIFAYTALEIGADVGPSAGEFMAYAFEAVSAFNTVGLSLGATPDLSGPGRLLTILLMFVGRVGPLAFASAISRPRRERPRVRYAMEDVVVG